MNAADFPDLSLAQALERLAEMPAYVQSLVAKHDAAAQRRQMQPGDFSLVEHACHLRDLECEGYLVRVERILAEDTPALAGFDGGAVAAARDYPSQDAAQAAAAFAAARHRLIAQVAALPAQLLDRTATFGDRQITLCGLLGMVAGHDAEHRQELQALDRWLSAA